jgi:asparagine synthase (glutamine-hydrolysing)
MCGIAGMVTRDGGAPDGVALEAMLDALAHRGPDGHGRHLSGDTALLQTRLAIIDLATGDQPLYEPGGAALVANGEIYNYVELRAEMTGTPFRTASDCETALFLYRSDGTRFAERLRGMYAIAIHDPADGGSLILARDPFGIKPLYYAETPTAFVFASEPTTILGSGMVSPGLDEDARDTFLQLQFSCGRDTPLRGIKRVLPGETLIVRGGRIVERHRRSALPDGGPERIGERDALARLDTAFRDSVTVHQRSDVPYGLFLSGGIDSGALLSMMAELNETPVVAFTAGFEDGDVHDERDHARVLARKVGARHEEVLFGRADFQRLLPRIAASVDDPTADYAVLPSWSLAERAAQDLKVVLCGEGGDELFGGYGRYRAAQRPWWLGGKPIRRRGVFDGLDVSARRPGRLAGQHFRTRGSGSAGGSHGAPNRPGRRLRGLAAQRPSGETGSLSHGPWARGANTVPRPRSRQGGVSPAGRSENQERQGKVPASPMAERTPSGSGRVLGQARFHGSRHRLDRSGRRASGRVGRATTRDPSDRAPRPGRVPVQSRGKEAPWPRRLGTPVLRAVA